MIIFFLTEVQNTSIITILSKCYLLPLHIAEKEKRKLSVKKKEITDLVKPTMILLTLVGKSL